MSQDLEEYKLRQYLLGELGPNEQVLIEQRLFLESSYAQLAQAVEDDLVDDYLHDDLTASELEGFKSHFLTQPERRGDLRIAQALKQFLATESFVAPVTGQRDEKQDVGWRRLLRNRRPLWFAWAAGVLIIISFLTWIAIRSIQRPLDPTFEAHVPQPSPTETLREQPGPSPVNPNPNDNSKVVEQRNSNEGSRPKSPGEQSLELTAVVPATILPNLTGRGEGASNEVSIPPTADGVLLKIPVVTIRNYDRYRLELISAGRRIEVQNLDVSVDEELGRIVSLLIPTTRLTKQRYEIRLRGLTAAGAPDELRTYSFTVKRLP